MKTSIQHIDSSGSPNLGRLNKIISALMLGTAWAFTVSQSNAVFADVISVPLSGDSGDTYDVSSNTGTKGADVGGRGDVTAMGGTVAYEFTTNPGTMSDQNRVSTGTGVVIRGGNGGNATVLGGRTATGGAGGAGISGSNLTITNSSGTIQGGDGGYGRVVGNAAATGTGGAGGAGIGGSTLTITNSSGAIRGGEGGYGTGIGAGGAGGAGISGSNLVITNSDTIQGGDGGNSIIAVNGGGVGGAGISGSNLTIVNSGKIIRGVGGIGGNALGASAAIRVTGGNSSLALNAGSEIEGDVSLSDMSDATSINTLSIASNLATTVSGNLTAGTFTGVSLSGEAVTFTGDAKFGDKTSLTFGSFGGRTALSASSLFFNNTDIKGGSNIANWSQAKYTLATTTVGIGGAYNDKTENGLLTPGKKDYAGVILTNSGKDLAYGLKWSDVGNNAENAYGTFDLKPGSTLTLGVALADNAMVTAVNASGWDGKSLTKDGLGTLILNAKSTYTGTTTVSAGVLKTGVVDAFASTSGVSVSSGATLNLAGNSQTLGARSALNNSGTVLINGPNAAALTSPVAITGDMVNSGLVVINNCTNCAGQTLQINGNWAGNGGTVSLGTVLGYDSSLTDKLAITGDATGTTKVKVANEGGTGAQTLEGIELIKTGGSTAGAFVQDGRIVAGSYDYTLQKGTASGKNANNWYLTSLYNVPDSGSSSNGGSASNSGSSSNGGSASNSGSSSNGGSGSEVGVMKHVYRPEAGGYASNLAAAATMFNLRLNDRQGEGYYVDRATGERRQSNVWLRYDGAHSRNQMVGGQLDNKSNRTVIQIGADVLGGSFNDRDLWRLGVMGGYGDQNTKTHNELSGYRSDAKISGYSVGLYGTWYQNGQDHRGFYVDSWALYNWFDNTIKGEKLRSESYKSKGFSASIEGGYNFRAGTVSGFGGTPNNLFIRPQGQVIWSDVRANGHTESNGTQVSGFGDGNVQTRLGFRVSLSPVDRQASSYIFEPFIEANWLHNTKLYGVEMGGVRSAIEGSRNIGESKVGLEVKLHENFSAWGTLGYQAGSDSYSETKSVIGMKYRF